MLPEVPFPVYFHFFFFKSNVISDFILSETQGKVTLEKGGSEGEKAMLSLRLTREGIPADKLSADVYKNAEILVQKGLMKKEQDSFKLTPAG